MEVRWTLRMAAAKREVWTGAQLRRLLAERSNTELSAASVSALMTKTPRQLKLSTLAALCTALDCQPGELIQVDTTPVARSPAVAPKAAQKRRSGGGRRTPPPF
jgi:DNA-binding Xre family transcriptional regulator